MASAKKIIINILKIAVPLSIGVYVIWDIQSSLEPEDKADLTYALSNTNYWFIALSIVGGLLSHMSRAWRWSYMLEPMGYKTRFWNNYHAVMIGYFMNLFVPRLGEASRCGAIYRYEKVPFSKAFGSVLAERAADLVILLSLTAVAFYFQFEKVQQTDVYKETLAKINDIDPWLLGGLAVGGLLVAYIGYRMLKHLPLVQKALEFVRGLGDGLKSILTMKKKWAFIGHTIFIWAMYVLMFYVCTFAIDATTGLEFSASLVAFVLAGYGIIVVPGGIGVYPAIVMGVLVLYGIDRGSGLGLGWIVWAAQTAMLIFFGAISLILMPIYNKDGQVRDTEGEDRK